MGNPPSSLLQELCPQVLVLDIFMPILDGIQVARRLQALNTTAKIVMLTGLEDQEYIDAALAAGVKGYVFKRKNGGRSTGSNR